MSFPRTRLTLIGRLSEGGSESDWAEFLEDYWGPICSFGRRWGRLSAQDAEDVAAETFQVILRNQLLQRWHDHPFARFRTLLCGVARKVMSNRASVAKGRERILRELAERPTEELPATIWNTLEPSEEQVDAFYQGWADDLLERCVDRLLADLHREGKGDCFRVLYGRVCGEMSTRQLAETLGITTTTAENYFKAAKKRLAVVLRTAVRQHVARYCDEASVDAEFQAEWSRLSSFLQQHGGLEKILRSVQQASASERHSSRKDSLMAEIRRIEGAGVPDEGSLGERGPT